MGSRGGAAPFLEYQTARIGTLQTQQWAQQPIYRYNGPDNIKTIPTLVQANDPENIQCNALDRTIIRWELNGIGPRIANRLFKLEDLVRIPRKYDSNGRQAFEGELGAKMARKKFEYFLEHYQVPGHEGKVFENVWEDRKRGHIIASNDGYTLNIREFPEVYLVYSKNAIDTKPITSFDGFFLRRDVRSGQLHVFIVESKVGSLAAKSLHKQINFFKEKALPGLQTIYQSGRKQDNAIITYVFCSTQGRIIRKEGGKDYLAHAPTYIKQQLEPLVNTLFLPINEGPQKIREMVDHIMDQKESIAGYETLTVRASPTNMLFLSPTKSTSMRLVALGGGRWQEVEETPEDQIID